MKGTRKNKLGKIEKNAKVKEDTCIFPFKYKRNPDGTAAVHDTCFDTPKGPICATEVNPKTGTLTKYGYCEEPAEVNISHQVEQKIERQIDHLLRRSPSVLKRKTLKKSKTKKLKTKNTTQESQLPEMALPTQRTVRKKRRKLKLVVPTPDLKSSPQIKPMEEPLKRYNEEFIDVLGELKDIMMGQGEPFRSRAYQKAQEQIMIFKDDITHPDQLKKQPNIGKTILTKLHEYVNTGKIGALERQRENPINKLTKVYGIGPKKAKELIADGIENIDQLRARPEVLNNIQKVGLQYYDAILERIPRSEIEEYQEFLTNIFNESTPPGSTFEIVGSFRRGKQQSGDIDMIITNDDNNKDAFNNFLDALIDQGIVLEVLTRGKTKSLTIAQLPGKTPRRVDFLYTAPNEYPFAILYFTGSKVFNTIMRQRALDLKMTLNEHGLYHMVNKKKGEKITGDFPDERSIFKALGMKYKEPTERIDGRALELGEDTPAATSLPPTTEPIEPTTKPVTKAKSEKKIKKKRKKLTLKNQDTSSIKQLIEQFKKEGTSLLLTLTEDQLSAIIREANNAYYCNSNPLLTDNQYDIIREYTLEHYPNNIAAKEGHTACIMEVEKNKVTLPYQMWSMDKIKPDTQALSKWQAKYAGPYQLSGKLDGVSGLYSTEGTTPKLYTRGNGIVGQDISHLIPYLQLPTVKDIVIRGEFIIPKDVFASKYAAKFANPRNFVAGVINQKKIAPDKYGDIDFVAYEVIKPELKPSEQINFLESNDVEVVRNVLESTINNELLSEILIAWRDDYKYEIDGVIVENDEIYPRTSGNPEHAFAFKMVLSDQIAEAKVVDVLWTPSKDGYLKPRVKIEPVVLGGATIEYATGFNGKFIEDNGIGVGALIRLIRSGDVIPHILAVIQPVEPQMPNVDYEWNDTHVDILLKDKSANQDVKEKNITGFFRNIGVEGLSTGNVRRIINAGYDTVPQIIAMSQEDLLEVAGFKQKLATKISQGIKEKIEQATLPDLMKASNIFGRGFGERRFKAILNTIPDILQSTATTQEKINQLKTVDGMAAKSAKAFVDKISNFITFMNEAGLQDKLHYEPLNQEVVHPLNGKKIVMTGFRDKELVDSLKAVGADVSNSVTKNTFIVLVKDKNEDTGKADQARNLGITLMTPDEIKEKYLEIL